MGLFSDTKHTHPGFSILESPPPPLREGYSGGVDHGPGAGGDSSIKMLRCVCWGFENVPILKDALGKKKHTNIEGFLGILHTHIMV